MTTCTIYGCNAAAPRNSEICFEHIKKGFAHNPGVEILLDRGAGTVSLANNTDQAMAFDMTFWTADATWRKSGYLDLLTAQFAVHESVMQGNSPYTGQMVLTCR